MASEAPTQIIKDWLAAAKTEAAGLSEVQGLSAFVIEKRQDLIVRAGEYPGRLRTSFLSDFIDVVVRRMLEIACEPTEEHPNLPARAERSLAIVATGGYGRRELAPFSDIDLNFLATSDDDPELDFITRKMFRLIMDVFLAGANLKVGYAYRLLGEAGGLHHQNQTALLDSRFVAGSRELFKVFQEELRSNIHPVAFIHDKLVERDNSMRKHGASVFRVEPEIKEGEGSLRDIQLASWLAQVAWGFPNKSVWEDIKAHGVLTAGQVQNVQDVLEYYSRIRWEMHLLAGQQADQLTVQKQEAVASKLGYTDSPEEMGVERLMREYFAHAQIARQTAEKMINRAWELKLQLEPGISTQNGRVILDNPEAFFNDPVAALRVFGYCQRYGLTLGQDVIDALRACVASAKAPIDDSDAAKLFVMMLRSEDVAQTLIGMAKTGVLSWFIPEFGEVMGLVPYDAAHEYTVGWHSLMVVKNCEDQRNSTEEDMRRIFSSIRQPELLYLFALTHDIGKAGSDGDHSEKGAIVARSIARRLRLDDESVEKLEFLVRHHLLMSDTARLRDLNLRKTLDDFVSVVNDTDLLSMLFVFTNADIQAVGSRSWSEIQARFLRELFHRAERAIVTKAPLIDSEEDMDLYRSRVKRELSLANLPAREVEEHVNRMPSIYLLNTGPEEMAQHIQFARKAIEGEPTVDFRSEPGSDFTQMTICVKDDPKPGLLSKIAAALWGLDVEVHMAQVYTRENSDKIALDVLYVDFEGKQLTDFKQHQVRRELIRVLKGETGVQEFLESKHKSLNPEYSSLSLEIHNHLSEAHSVVDIQAKDQPGLLYRFTRAFAVLGWGIHSARVSTWGNEARDSFYVTVDNGKLDVKAAEQLEEALKAGS